MKAIVLSPGPSLTRYEPQPCDLLIGVNRAAMKFACDVWCCGDTTLIESIESVTGKPLHEAIIGSPLLVSYNITLDTLRDHSFTWRGETFAWTKLADACLHPSVVNWPWCTFTAAIVYAAWRGATRIEVFGADWDGTEDFDGASGGQIGKNRSPDRWREERGIFGALQKVLGDRGVEIVRL